MKISKGAEYGLMAMIFLAKNPVRKSGRSIFSLREISAETKTSFVFLEKIFSKLEKVGLVKGIIGVRGGYVLARSPKKISANDIVSVLDGSPGEIVNCVGCNNKGNCAAKVVWAQVELALRKTLSSITLADLIK